MTTAPLNYKSPEDSAGPAVPARRPRLISGLVLVALMWLLIKLPALIVPGSMLHIMSMFWGPVASVVVILIWWSFFSRFPARTRWMGVVAFAIGTAIAFGLGHPSMPMGYLVFALPVIATVWVLWAVVSYRMGSTIHRTGMVVLIVGLWTLFALLRLDGLNGSLSANLSWRWSKTAEERYIASRAANNSVTAGRVATTTPAAPLELQDGDWPEFRGPRRDGRLTGVTIRTDWSQRPLKQLWKHLIGPGWSSICVVGDRIFTQEQRGQIEAVVCYQADTGLELWSHDDSTRFAEPIAGPGPRSTPTFANGKLYTLGANGRLNCLDPLTGGVLWTHDVKADVDAPVPTWGFSSSPLVANGRVSVITGAKGKSVVAYNAETGAPAWSAGEGWSYSSLQQSTLDGVDQLLYVSDAGVAGMEPATGKTLWQHKFPLTGGANRAVQPTVVGPNDFLVGAAFGVGTRRVHLTHSGTEWKDSEVWMSKSIRPYYNDMVLHNGYLYGFDGNGSVAFVCVDANTGERKWRTMGYDGGQVLLLADQGLLLILSEAGEAFLVDAKPDGHHVVASFQAVNGKTWNHPVISHGRLFVRNGEEIACYELK